MKHPLFVFACVLLALTVLSCNKDNNPNAPNNTGPYLTGTVDWNGMPLAGAGVHFKPVFPGSSAGSGHPKALITTVFRYTVPRNGNVSVIVYRLGTNQLMDTLVHRLMAAGVYEVQYVVDKLTNGVYYDRVTLDDSLIARSNLVLIKNDSDLVHCDPITETNAGGKFTLPTSVFAVGMWVAMEDPTPVAISDSVDIIFTRADFGFKKQRIRVDTTLGTQARFFF